MDETNKSDVENNLPSDDFNQLNQNNNEPDNTNNDTNAAPAVSDDVTKQQQRSPPSSSPTESKSEPEQLNEQNPSDILVTNHDDYGGNGNTAGDSSVIEQNNSSCSTVTKCDSNVHTPNLDQTPDATTTTTTENLLCTEMEHEPIVQPVTQDEPPDPPDEQTLNETEPETKAEAVTMTVTEPVASPKSNPSESYTNNNVNADNADNAENIKSVEQQPHNNDNANIHDDDDNVDDTNQMSQNQTLIDNSDDLLVPTDYVPDSADVIGDDSKRRHSQSDEASGEPFKKFKHDTLSDEDVSMSDGMDDLNEMCIENEVSDQPVAIVAAAAVAAAAAADSVANEEKMAVSRSVEPPSSSSPPSPPPPPPSMPSPEQQQQQQNCESATANDDELNIADIFSGKGIDSAKTEFSLVDIIDNADDLISKNDDEHSEMNSDDSLQKSKLSSEQCSDDVVDNGAATTSATEDTDSTVETGKKAASAEELNFDISEKLKEMGEISVAPVSKTATNERKPSLADFDLGDEVSLEQIKKSTTGDSDDKRNKVSNLRKNIREVMDDNQLDASTLAAQREELERLARVQEQQRMIREMQRQVALDRQNSKTQNKVLSLLTGHTSLLKSSTASTSSTSTSSTTSSSVVAPVAAGELASGSSSTDVDDILAGKTSNLTPSVSIAPIKMSRKKSTESNDVASDIASKSIEPCEIDLDSDEKFNQLDKSDDNDLMIVDEDSEEEDEDDDDVVELKAKRDIVEIEDSSDDDCIM